MDVVFTQEEGKQTASFGTMNMTGRKTRFCSASKQNKKNVKLVFLSNAVCTPTLSRYDLLLCETCFEFVLLFLWHQILVMIKKRIDFTQMTCPKEYYKASENIWVLSNMELKKRC